MNLIFTKQGDLYIATAEVNADFNLHIEIESDYRTASVSVLQKTTGEKYASVAQFTGVSVLDEDFDGIVYPKTIKIISSMQVHTGIITEA